MERSIRESELAELISMAIQLQERSELSSEDSRLSDGQVQSIGERLGIPAGVMDHALRNYRELRRDVFRSALGSWVRDELLRKMRDVKLRDLFQERQRVERRIQEREDHLRRHKKEMSLLDLLNPFSTSPTRQEAERQKEALGNERKHLRHVEKRLVERLEEVFDTVAPLSVVLRTEKTMGLLQELGAPRFTPAGEAIQEAIQHQKAMRQAMQDAFGPIPPRLELLRMVLDALPLFYEELEDHPPGNLLES